MSQTSVKDSFFCHMPIFLFGNKSLVIIIISFCFLEKKKNYHKFWVSFEAQKVPYFIQLLGIKLIKS